VTHSKSLTRTSESTPPGGTYDPGSKLMHFGQRWCDPTTGRFTQQDSLESLANPSRANRYEYAGGDPVNYVDPAGLEQCFVDSSNGSYYCRDNADLVGPGLDLTCPAIGAGIGVLLSALAVDPLPSIILGFVADAACDVYNP
jgi:RHS repeat-associated protein